MNALKAPNCFSTANEDKLNDLRQKAGNAYQVLGSRGAPPKGRLETLAARGLGTAPTTALSETDSVRASGPPRTVYQSRVLRIKPSSPGES
jgi:hypothetical protein